MVVRNHAERSRQLQTYMRTNLEEIQWAEQTDATLTKIKARGEQRIERSKRRPRTSMVAVGYACRCARPRTFLPPYDAARFRNPFRMPHFSERFRDSKDRCFRP